MDPDGNRLLQLFGAAGREQLGLLVAVQLEPRAVLLEPGMPARWPLTPASACLT